MSVGAHSPNVHGKLIESFFEHRWHLARDRHSRDRYDLKKSEPTGAIVNEGEPALVNSNLGGGEP